VARGRLQELCAQYGEELVAAVSAEMLRYSEQILRSRLLEIPDGTWTAEGLVQTTDSWKAVLTLTKTRDHLLFDFTGTDPQAPVGINLPYHATLGACFGAVQGLLGWDIPRNHGAFGPIEVIAPPGTIMNVRAPAPVSLNTTSGGAVAKYLADSVLTQMAATSDKWRTEVGAKNVGGRRARHAGVNQYGTYYVSTFGGLSGSGARATADGVDAGGSTITVHNVEWVESGFPLLYLYRRHIKDGGGAGTYRGGVGDEVALVLHDAPAGTIKCIAYGVAGAKNSGQGLFGGFPGAPSVVGIVRGTRVREILTQNEVPDDLSEVGGTTEVLGYTEFQLGPDDAFFLASASGGGYGDPLEREPLSVADDVARGLVSVEAAQDVYGVVMVGGVPDLRKTAEAREGLRRRRSTDRLMAERPTAGNGVRLHPLRENLEVCETGEGRWVRCAACKEILGPETHSWADLCAPVVVSPDAAGPLFVPLAGGFVLEQRSCPACGALVDSDIVAAAPDGSARRHL
jgi:N-methylhydantoinase B